MSANIEERLGRLRNASAELCALAVAERIDRVAALLDAWASPDSSWQRALGEELPAATGFSAQMVREGSKRGFAPLCGDALRKLLQDERPAPAASASLCTAILAGAVPMPTLLATVAPLVLGTAVALKASASDRVSPRLVSCSAAALDPLLGRCIDVFSATDARQLRDVLRADVVSITGSDESVEEIAELAPPSARVVRHGHRFSAAVVGDRATRGPSLAAVSRALALDVALWDQLGCLSPVGVWIVGGDPGACDRLADSLFEALGEAERRWPRGTLDLAARASFQHAVETDTMRDASVLGVRTLAGSEWCVVREPDPALRPVPLYRYMRVYPAAGMDALCESIGADRTHLAALAVAGLSAQERAALVRLQPSRLCEVGQLQTPPLDWRRDHLGVVSSLELPGASS